MEDIAKITTQYISHTVEVLAAVIIGIALIRTATQFLQWNLSFLKDAVKPLRQPAEGLEGLRVQFGSSVAVALELLLGADVLATAVAPNWNDIGKLAAIAVLRTALNYFLGKELKEIQHNKAVTNN